tara:strand:+ start:751 stop:927 length:177 start_codon:yes stop_codon:yes gene_type:complete
MSRDSDLAFREYEHRKVVARKQPKSYKYDAEVLAIHKRSADVAFERELKAINNDDWMM